MTSSLASQRNAVKTTSEDEYQRMSATWLITTRIFEVLAGRTHRPRSRIESIRTSTFLHRNCLTSINAVSSDDASDLLLQNIYLQLVLLGRRCDRDVATERAEMAETTPSSTRRTRVPSR